MAFQLFWEILLFVAKTLNLYVTLNLLQTEGLKPTFGKNDPLMQGGSQNRVPQENDLPQYATQFCLKRRWVIENAVPTTSSKRKKVFLHVMTDKK